MRENYSTFQLEEILDDYKVNYREIYHSAKREKDFSKENFINKVNVLNKDIIKVALHLKVKSFMGFFHKVQNINKEFFFQTRYMGTDRMKNQLTRLAKKYCDSVAQKDNEVMKEWRKHVREFKNKYPNGKIFY